MDDMKRTGNGVDELNDTAVGHGTKSLTKWVTISLLSEPWSIGISKNTFIMVGVYLWKSGLESCIPQ